MNRFFEYVVEMRLAGKRQSETVQRIEIVVENHFEVFEYGSGEFMSLIENEQEWFFLLLEQMIQAVLNNAEHGRFAVGSVDAKGVAELAVELHGADGGKAEVGNFVEVTVDGFGEAAECVRFAETGRRSEHADAADIFEIGEPGGHFLMVVGEKRRLL